jgi:hypothetical protein
LAEPDTVVIAASTHRLVGDLFEVRDLGTVTVKGLAAPVPASQVLRPSVVASRFEALRGSALTRLVGRDEEIELLLRRWARAKAGDGQVVLVSGEPGIGKSKRRKEYWADRWLALLPARGSSPVERSFALAVVTRSAVAPRTTLKSTGNGQVAAWPMSPGIRGKQVSSIRMPMLAP